MLAEAPSEDRVLFRRLLQEEIEARFRIEAHLEKRPFDVFVLRAGGAPQLQPDTHEPSSRVSMANAELRGATLDRVAAAVQSVLGKPVIDETGISGVYRVDFAWGEDRVATVSSMLENKFGLILTAARRDLDALIVDRIEPDGAVSVLTQVGRITSRAPALVRRAIAGALTIH